MFLDKEVIKYKVPTMESFSCWYKSCPNVMRLSLQVQFLDSTNDCFIQVKILQNMGKITFVDSILTNIVQ